MSLGHSRIVAPSGVVVVEAPALVDATVSHRILPADAHRGNALESLELKPLADWWRAGLRLLPESNAASEAPSEKAP